MGTIYITTKEDKEMDRKDKLEVGDLLLIGDSEYDVVEITDCGEIDDGRLWYDFIDDYGNQHHWNVSLDGGEIIKAEDK